MHNKIALKCNPPAYIVITMCIMNTLYHRMNVFAAHFKYDLRRKYYHV